MVTSARTLDVIEWDGVRARGGVLGRRTVCWNEYDTHAWKEGGGKEKLYAAYVYFRNLNSQLHWLEQRWLKCLVELEVVDF